MIGVDEMFLIPSPGLIVRDPRTKTPLPGNGTIVPWTGSEGRYWRRRVSEGSCKIGSPAVPIEPQKEVTQEVKSEDETIVPKERKIRR